MPILFEGKYKRARKFQQEQNAKRGGLVGNQIPLGTQMEKGDLPAMIIAALITILPVAIVVLVVIAAAGYFFVVR